MRDPMLILHFIGLAMGLGTSLAHAFLGMAASKMTPEEAVKFRMHTLVLSRMGHIGLGLLIISGLYLMTPFWKVLPKMPLLMIKLALVIVLAILIGLIGRSARKAKEGDAAGQLKIMEKYGKMTLIIALTIVILAVSIFH